MDDLNQIQNDVSKITDICIKSIRLCLLDTENVVSIAIKMIERKNPNSSDLSFLKNEYYIKIHNLSQLYSNMSNNQFHDTIKDTLKELNEIYKNVGNKLIQIIKNNEINNLSKVMTNMPLLVTEMFSNLKDYTRLSINQISAAKNEIKDKVEEHIKSSVISSYSPSNYNNNSINQSNNFNSNNNNQSSNNSSAPTRIIFNPNSTVSTGNNYSSSGFSLNDNNQYDYLTEGLWSGISNTVYNAWKILTFSSIDDGNGNSINPVAKAFSDANESIDNLKKESDKCFNKAEVSNNPDAFLSMCGKFFTSDAFLSTLAGLLTIITIILLLRKAYKRIKNWLIDKYYKLIN